MTLRDKPNILDKLFVLFVPRCDVARIVVPPSRGCRKHTCMLGE